MIDLPTSFPFDYEPTQIALAAVFPAGAHVVPSEELRGWAGARGVVRDHVEVNERLLVEVEWTHWPAAALQSPRPRLVRAGELVRVESPSSATAAAQS